MIDLESLAEEGKKEDYNEWCRYSKETKNYKTIVTALSNGSRVVAGHNYGDLSADHYMDAIEEAMERSPEITLDYIRSLRLSMDHGGLYPRPDQLPRIKRLGMWLGMGSAALSRSLPWIEKYGFEKYQGWVMPTKRALEAGIKVAWEGEGGAPNSKPGIWNACRERNKSDQRIRGQVVRRSGLAAGLPAVVWSAGQHLLDDPSPLKYHG